MRKKLLAPIMAVIALCLVALTACGGPSVEGLIREDLTTQFEEIKAGSDELVEDIEANAGAEFDQLGVDPAAFTNSYLDGFDYEIGKSVQLQDGNDLTIIGTGETVYHALQAGRRLAAGGVSTRVIDMHTLKPADTDAIIRAAKETGRILTVEEHSMFGGLGGIVAETVAQNCPVPMRILGIPDENAVHGKPLEIFHHYKLDADGIYETAKEMVK